MTAPRRKSPRDGDFMGIFPAATASAGQIEAKQYASLTEANS
jgi:hypothetical protein